VAVARAILGWATSSGLRSRWGKGQQDGSFFPMVDRAGGTDWTVSVWTTGTVEVQFEQLARAVGDLGRHPFGSDEKRLELLQRFNDVPGITIPSTAIARRPNIPLSVLVEPEAQGRFLATLDWLVTELRTAPTTTG